MLKIAFSTISCPTYTLRQMAEAVRLYDYDGIELYAFAGQPLHPAKLAQKLPEFQQELKGIPIVMINSWGTLSNSDASERLAQEKQIRRTFELAAALNCPCVKTFGGAMPGNRAKEEVFAYMTESLLRLAPRARELGITLAIETHDGFCLGADLARLLARVDDPSIAALWDVHHPYRMGEDVAETDRAIGTRVVHAHVKDALRAGDGWRYVLLGKGQLPIPALLRCLQARHFDGYVSVDWEKIWHPEIEEPEIALPWYSKALRKEIRHAITEAR